jgi:TatD DNase family protein
LRGPCKTGITGIIVPGTDPASSKRALDIARQYDFIYAAVGIHPHHLFNAAKEDNWDTQLSQIEALLLHPKVVAVGEVGLDEHVYEKTKYETYQLSDEFLALQKEMLVKQIRLAHRFGKALILHNREAKEDLVPLLSENRQFLEARRVVLHCCEPDPALMDYAQKQDMFIGIDGDITYDSKKQKFAKTVPLDRLVLETDAPYLLPEPLRAARKFPNEPGNITLIAQCIAQIRNLPVEEVIKTTSDNARALFGLPEVLPE